MGKIYLGKNSYFKIPVPKSKAKKAIVNAYAQALDFADFKTVVKTKKGYKKVKFTYYPEDVGVSFVGRTAVILRYAPDNVVGTILTILRLAEFYHDGRISKRKYIKALDKLVSKYLTKSERTKIKRLISAKS